MAEARVKELQIFLLEKGRWANSVGKIEITARKRVELAPLTNAVVRALHAINEL